MLATLASLAAIQSSGQNVTIPDTGALPASAADTTKPGFLWRVHQVASSQPTTLARTEAQLRENLAATGWNLTTDQVKRLDAASETQPVYPYWHQRSKAFLNTAPDLYGHSGH